MSLKNLNAIKTPSILKKKISNKKIKRLYKFFEKNLNTLDSCVVAVSGGPDSLALAFLMKLYSLKHNINCYFFIVDHKLRNDSTNEACKVKKILNKLSIKAEIIAWNGRKPSKNIQSLARKKRYELLFLRCKKLKIQNLVIGHHLDDLYENFFLRMIRGSGLKGLVSLDKIVQISNINLIRPLLDFEKKDLEFISDHVFNFFVRDPSNKNTNFKRIKIRNMIDQLKNNGMDKNKLFLTLKNLKRSDQVIKFYVERNKFTNSFIRKKKEILLNKDFFDQPYEIVFRSFSDILKVTGNKYYPPRGKKIDTVLDKIFKNSLIKETLAGCTVKKVNQTVIIAKEY